MTHAMPSWHTVLLAGLKAGRDLDDLLPGLPDHLRELMEKAWRPDARDDQLPPEGEWLTWLLLGGRGAGKTRAGAEWVRGVALGIEPFAAVKTGPIALVGETFADVREVMIEGVSGLLRLHESWDRPIWQPTRRRLEWRNGMVAHAFSSEDPEGLRGPQFAAAWSDGKPFDLSTVTHRLHKGGESQDPDSLIEAKQGEGAAPAYRGTAIIVFERMPLAKFGNRVPQFSFEVIRPIGELEKQIRAVTIIPGATEFGYDPDPVRQVIKPGHKRLLNRHVDGARTDWGASLNELQDLCPNLDRAGLVVAWYGDDLRANHCTLKPGVVDRDITTKPEPWKAAGLTRATARLVSTFEGRAAYGGTPSDATVVRAIQDLKDRGLAVTFYPFILMDIPAGNGLTDPYGGAEQGAYPWRGVMTASEAPGIAGSPDKTATAADQIAAFVGTAAPSDFHISGETVTYDGPDEWSYRRLVLHYAKLCKAAGGVDAFLIGSELRGLTTLRSATSTYPFVTALIDLADDVRGILGGATKISYAADWTEYFGHQPADGTGDVHFHLDPLWSSPDIDFVGIDNYMPLADWRDGSDHTDAATFESGRAKAYLRANIAAGEGYDWYYAGDAARAAQTRSAITDGAYGKPWVFRYKDLAGWWGNAHYNRPGGVEAASPTGWTAMGKPIWFTELGCPAVDKGANQPNVFPDPKSSASAYPYFSNLLRDDLVQRRFLEASLRGWNPADADHVAGANPTSPAYGGPMVDWAKSHVWTWDARPYPAFPTQRAVWADGDNHETGHWLTGRLGAFSADELVRAILAEYGIADAVVDELDGTLDGYLIDAPISARAALEPLAALTMFEAYESGDALRIVPRGRKAKVELGAADFAEDGGRPLLIVRRGQETELPAEIAVGFADPLADFRSASVASRRLATGSRRSEGNTTSAVMSHAVASGIADAMLQDIWAGRETWSFTLTARGLALEPADICAVAAEGAARTVMITRIEDADARRIEARSIEPSILTAAPAAPRVLDSPAAEELVAPEIVILDLPLLGGTEAAFAPRIAAFAEPWPGPIAVAIGTPDTGYVPRQGLERRATIGELIAPLAAGPEARFDRAHTIDVTLYGGGLASAPLLGVLNGGNAAAIGTEATGFEVIQFETATLIDPATYRLSGLLRGQGGTGDIAVAGHAAGARFVVLDGAVEALGLTEAEASLALVARCGPAGAVYDPDTFTDVAVAGNRRGLACLPPVHLRAARDPGSGDVMLRWIRQTRIGGDAWEPVEVPLGEANEAYRVEILDGVAVVRTVAVATPSAAYAAAEQAADFGGLPPEIGLRVSQTSATEGQGIPAEALIAF